MIPKDYGFAPGIKLRDPVGHLIAQPDQLKRLFNRIRPSFSITGITLPSFSSVVAGSIRARVIGAVRASLRAPNFRSIGGSTYGTNCSNVSTNHANGRSWL